MFVHGCELPVDFVVQALIERIDLTVEPPSDRIEFFAERYEMPLERGEARVGALLHRVEALLHRVEALVNADEASIHVSPQPREPAIHLLFEVSNRHAKAANHSIVWCDEDADPPRREFPRDSKIRGD